MSQHVAALKRVSFCADLDETTIKALAAVAVLIQRHAGTVIQLEGEPAEAMYVVVQGRVKIARVATNGREQVLHIASIGHHFNTVPLFDGGPCPANAEALTDVQLLVLPRTPFLHVVEHYPKLAQTLLKEFTGRLRHLVNLVDELSLHTVQGRLAQLLLTQAIAAERGDEVPAMTQTEIAAHLGTVREMVARTLKSFETLGLIQMERGAITVLDRVALAAQAEH